MKSYRIAVYTLIFLVLAAVLSFAETAGQDAKDSAVTVQVYAGMPKEELYKIYPPKYQTAYHLKDRMEIITFDDYLTKQAGDTVTFFLKDGKLDWWDRVQAKSTPEDRLRAVMNRAAHVQPPPLSYNISTLDPNVIYIKKSDRADNIGASNVKKYFKGVR